MKNILSFCLLSLVCANFSMAQIALSEEENFINHNKPAREEWLRDAGFGLFIHFSFDSQLGVVISHSMVGASDDYLDRFINELPKTFDPHRFSAKEIAILAKLAGMKYIVLTTKHHSGFCLWDTKTTDFNIMNTAYGKDLVAEYVKETREQGLAVGFYFSPEDFHFLHSNGELVRRNFPDPIPDNVMEAYVGFTERQCRELMTNYGQIDVIFFDGGEGPLQEKAKEVSWALQPDILVTRGAMKTPEQTIPGLPSEKPWEACITMGTQWQYKPTNEQYKSGGKLIEVLIESRAKGGALLLNVGPKPNGELPIEQEERMRELAAWAFINKESIENVRPWTITNEGDIWFSKSKDGQTVYAYLTKLPDWERGARKDFVLKSIKATAGTKVSVLGQNDKIVEYNPGADATTRFEQKEDGLHVSCVRAQRIYNNHKWPNPIVIKLENVAPALAPPFVQTTGAIIQADKVVLLGELIDMGDATDLYVGFKYREYAGFTEALDAGDWQGTKLSSIKQNGEYKMELDGLVSGKEYQFRAVVKHPKIEVLGEIKQFKQP